MQGIGFTRLQRDAFHRVDHRCLVRFRCFVHDLNINGVRQAFRIFHRQAEGERLVLSHCRRAEGGFGFRAVGKGHGWTGNLGPLIGNGVAVRIARRRAIKGDGNRPGHGLIGSRSDRRMVGDNGINRR